MGTWASFTAELRTWLADSGAQKFTEAELYGYCRRATIDLSLRLPKIVVDAVSVAGGVASMPEDWLGTPSLIVAVDSTVLKPARTLPVAAGSWLLIGGTLSIGTVKTAATLTYEARYECPEEYDADEEVDVPDVDQECIFWYASGLAIGREAGEDSSLSRWSDKKRDDSPLLPEHRWRFLRYLDCVNLRRTTRAQLDTRALYG